MTLDRRDSRPAWIPFTPQGAVALACNVVRVAILALLVDRFGADILDTAMHPASGWLTFTVAALILFFVAEWRGRRAPS